MDARSVVDVRQVDARAVNVDARQVHVHVTCAPATFSATDFSMSDNVLPAAAYLASKGPTFKDGKTYGQFAGDDDDCETACPSECDTMSEAEFDDERRPRFTGVSFQFRGWMPRTEKAGGS